MAFNREDLITYSELAPSLQAIFEGMQTQISRQQSQYTQIQEDIQNIGTNPDFQSMVQSEVQNQLNAVVSQIVGQVTENYEFAAQNDINQLKDDLQAHTLDKRPHPNTGAEFLIRRPLTDYQEGDCVWVPELPNYFMLECVQGGTTAQSRPNFAALND